MIDRRNTSPGTGALAVVLVAGLMADAATDAEAASVSYAYSGSPFNAYSLGAPPGLEAVSGYFTVATSLSPSTAYDANRTLGDASRELLEATEWSFSDGLSVVSNEDVGSGTWRVQSLFVETDATGAILAWSVDLRRVDHTSVGHRTLYSEANTRFAPPADGSAYCVPGPGFECFTAAGSVTGLPGTWRATVVPVPGAIWLFGSALAAGIAFRRQRSRAD
jgi:hypothetical protein